MKNLKITLLALFISVVAYAQQGIVFQGIARDNSSAAITDETLTFTFRITKSDGSELYKETQQIRTDNFGVFSHVIGTGTPVTGAFGGVDFQQADLKSIINVNHNGNDAQIYNQPFQYVPYAKVAGNGVPVGTVMPFLGDNAPDGWLLCHGQSIADAKYAKLRAVSGWTTVPDLRGRFLKGAGISSNIPITQYDEVGARAYQDQSMMRHYHDKGNLETESNGGHSHSFQDRYFAENQSGGSNNKKGSTNGADSDNSFFSENNTTDHKGAHTHTIKGNTGKTGTEENRPWSFTVNYIVKY